MVLVSSFYAFPCKNGSIAKQTIFQLKMQSDAVQYFSERTLIYRKILNGIFLPLFFRLSMASGGTLGEVPEFGHFVFFLPTKNPPWLVMKKTKKRVYYGHRKYSETALWRSRFKGNPANSAYKVLTQKLFLLAIKKTLFKAQF